MKSINWKIALNQDKIASIEQAKGFNQDSVESHLSIMGVLEVMKDKVIDGEYEGKIGSGMGEVEWSVSFYGINSESAKIGALENLKQKHQEKLKTLYSQTKRQGIVDEEDREEDENGGC